MAEKGRLLPAAISVQDRRDHWALPGQKRSLEGGGQNCMRRLPAPATSLRSASLFGRCSSGSRYAGSST